MRYDTNKIPEPIIKTIIKALSEGGTGANPAIESERIYNRVARMYAEIIGDPRPFTASLICKYKKVPGTLYSLVYCPIVDEVLHEYFNSINVGDAVYWYTKKTPKSAIKKWLGDDFKGVMESS